MRLPNYLQRFARVLSYLGQWVIRVEATCLRALGTFGKDDRIAPFLPFRDHVLAECSCLSR
jgi:hypothetical protein